MRECLPVRGLLLALVAALPGFADEAPADKRSDDLVAPYVDPQTLVVAHLNLMAFDAAETVDWLAELVNMPDRERDKLRADAALVGIVTQTVAKETPVDVFVVSGLADMARLPFFVVLPTGKGSPAAAIAVELRRDLEKAWQRQLVTQQIGQALVTGSEETIERLKEAPAADRPDVAAALRATEGGALRVAFVPPAELRGLLEGILPEQLPKQLGGGPTKVFTQGALWVAAGMDLPPHNVAVRLTLQSADADAATALDQELVNVFAAVAQLPGIKDAIPDFEELAEQLRPRAMGDQLKLELTEENGGVDALTKLFGPVLRALLAAMASR